MLKLSAGDVILISGIVIATLWSGCDGDHIKIALNDEAMSDELQLLAKAEKGVCALTHIALIWT